MTIPASTSFASRLRTVVSEPMSRRKSCFGVSGCPCSAAYPISMMISKSMSALMKGNFNRSNCLIFRNAANNCMFSRYFL
jgi:hypothetical protein